VSAIPKDGTGRLLFFLEQRLAQLRWSREDLASQGGPSPSTVYKCVAGERRPTERTLARLELALGWQPGSAHRILDGGAPAMSISHEVATVASRIDQELSRGESVGVARTAKELREFLMGVAQGLERFYAGPEPAAGEVLNASAS
jgi:hypothetical protein